MYTEKFDVAIVGSGAAGVSVAYPLVRAGLKVVMIDGGLTPLRYSDFRTQNFEDIRTNNADQYKLFLGEDFSGFPSFSNTHALSMTSGSRNYITSETDRLLPVSSNFNLFQSLAKGGLSEVWGGVCDFFTSKELKEIGQQANLHADYQEVIDRIGVSGKKSGYRLQIPLISDNHASTIFRRYQNKKDFFQKIKFEVYKPYLAVLSQKKNGRTPNSYNDLDFWSDDGSIYRPRYDIDRLITRPNFRYIKHSIVTEVKDSANSVNIVFFNFVAKQKLVENIRAKFVVFAAGSINTTRILLKSFRLYNKEAPVLLKPNIITPCLNMHSLGVRGNVKKHSLCQLILSDVSETGLVNSYSQMYSYKSLLLSKLISSVPLSTPLAFDFLSLLTPSLVLVDTRFPVKESKSKYVKLKVKNGRDYLEVVGAPSHPLTKDYKYEFNKVRKSLLKLGLLPTKSMFMPEGSTVHYAGGVPVTSDNSYELSVNEDLKLRQANRIYVADSSTWKCLPAKPPTLTIMALANRLGNHLVKINK